MPILLLYHTLLVFSKIPENQHMSGRLSEDEWSIHHADVLRPPKISQLDVMWFRAEFLALRKYQV